MQYIGARYVPKFMGAYDNTQAYENMCVVDNGMGTSYISKKPTPAGTPLTDTDYWAIYGASSGAIINLQNQIGDITNLTTSHKDHLVDAINEVNSKIIDLSNYVTPQMFGGVGDGVNDDTQALIDAIATGKTIYLPVGTYLISSEITISNANTKIIGHGNDSLIKYTGNSYLFSISNNNVILRDFKIEGSGTADYSNTSGYAVTVYSNNHNITIDNVEITKIGTGIKLDHCWDVQLNKVRTYYTNKAVLCDTIASLTMINCTLYYSSIGVDSSASAITALSFYSDNCKLGIKADGRSTITVYGYIIEGGRDSGSTLNTCALEQVDIYSKIIIYKMAFYDDSGTFIIARVDSALGLVRGIEIFNLVKPLNAFTFDINNSADYGCVSITCDDIDNYVAAFPDKVKVNGCYPFRLSGVYTNQGYRKYKGIRANAAVTCTGSFAIGTITMYHDGAIIKGDFYWSNNTLVKNAPSGMLISALGGNTGVMIEKSSSVTSDYYFEIECLTDGYMSGSDNQYH